MFINVAKSKIETRFKITNKHPQILLFYLKQKYVGKKITNLISKSIVLDTQTSIPYCSGLQ